MQNNVDRSKITQDIVLQTAARENVDMVILNEPNKRVAQTQGWHVDSRIDVAIIIRNRNIAVDSRGRGNGFAWIETESFVLYSCYCSPNIDAQAFQQFLNELDLDVGQHTKPIIVGGDFNAKSPEWRSPTENLRGTDFVEWIYQRNLVVLNQGDRPTFIRYSQTSYIDLTLCSERLSADIVDWRVMEEETLGCHQVITFHLKIEEGGPTRTTGDSNENAHVGWRILEEAIADFEAVFHNNIMEERQRSGNNINSDKFLKCVTDSCDRVFWRKLRSPRGKQGAYWWNDDIRETRIQCLANRRRLVRANRSGTQREKENALREYRCCRRMLKKKIMTSKRQAWKDLLSELDRDQ